MPKALITGASSGIGACIARELSAMGYETVLVARRTDRLFAIQKELESPSYIVTADLSDMEQVKNLASNYTDIDILINNAGFGVYGDFTQTDFVKESEMLDVNILALHFLMKAYIPIFEKRGGGKILNVASSAAFFSGPLLSSYYASKSYVLKLSTAVREELRRRKSPVSISVLCPGPVETEFWQVSGTSLSLGAISAQYAAKVAVSGLMKKRAVIVPGFMMKCSRVLSKIVPEAVSVRILYNVQRAKKK